MTARTRIVRPATQDPSRPQTCMIQGAQGVHTSGEGAPREVTLEAGHVVLPGSLTAAIDVKAGDIVTATFAGLGNVTARFRPITAQGETTGAS